MQGGNSFQFGLRPPKLRRLINPLIAFGSITASSWLFWEWVYRKPFKRDLRFREAHFNGETAFYGKSWGYSTDYLIEHSLKEGDILFFSYNFNSLHLHQAITKYISNSFSGTHYDEVGIIHVKDGIKYILSLGPFAGVKITRYSDKLATADSTTIALRRLQYVNPNLLESLKSYIDKNLEELKLKKFSTISTIWWNIQRRRTHSEYFSKINNMIDLEWDKRALKMMNEKLCDLVNIENVDSTTKDKVISTSQRFNNISWWKISFFNTPDRFPQNPEIDVLVNKNQNLINSIEATVSNLRSQNNFPGTTPNIIFKKGDLKGFIASYINSVFLKTQTHSSASFIIDILIELGLLPAFVPPVAWTMNDLNSIKTLYSKDMYAYKEYKSSAVLPIFSHPFYIRQDDTERQLKRH